MRERIRGKAAALRELSRWNVITWMCRDGDPARIYPKGMETQFINVAKSSDAIHNDDFYRFVEALAVVCSFPPPPKRTRKRK